MSSPGHSRGDSAQSEQRDTELSSWRGLIGKCAAPWGLKIPCTRGDTRRTQLVHLIYDPVDLAARSVFSRAADQRHVNELRLELDKLKNSVHTFCDSSRAELSGQPNRSARTSLLKTLRAFQRELSRLRPKEERNSTRLSAGGGDMQNSQFDPYFKLARDVIRRKEFSQETAAAFEKAAQRAHLAELNPLLPFWAPLGVIISPNLSFRSTNRPSWKSILARSLVTMVALEPVLYLSRKTGVVPLVSALVRTHFGEAKAPSLDWWCRESEEEPGSESDDDGSDNDTVVDDPEPWEPSEAAGAGTQSPNTNTWGTLPWIFRSFYRRQGE